MSEMHFLPWLRRGLAAALTDPDPGSGAVDRAGDLEMFIDVGGARATRAIAMHPPDHVTAIGAAEVVRRYPAPDATDAEVGYFPVAELAAADLPWMFTPLAPGGADARLRPWISLVCVDLASGAEYRPAAGDRPAELTTPVAELPDPGETWAWAHVQATVEADALAADPELLGGRAIARLVCPRRLRAGRTYRAAIVSAWRRDGERIAPAWDLAAEGSVTLSAYHSWTFTTGPGGDFESLCRRLAPVVTAHRLGVRDLDVSDPGAVLPWPAGTRVVVEYSGALWDIGVTAAGLGEHRAAFQEDLTEVLDAGGQRVVVERGGADPVVGPPLYGAFSSGAAAVPASGWQRDLNLVPARRAAAGLGAEVVRRNQERFVAAAWDQAGQLRETNLALTATRLQAEIARGWQARVEALPDGDVVQVARHALTWVTTSDGLSGRRALRTSGMPEALVGAAFIRQTRPAGVVARASEGRLPTGRPLRREATETMLSATAAAPPPAVAACLDFATPPALPRASTAAYDVVHEMPVLSASRRVTPDEAMERGLRRAGARARTAVDVGGALDSVPGPLAGGGATPPVAADASSLAGILRGGVDLLGTARARIEARVTGLGALMPSEGLPTTVRLGPVIDESLYRSLQALGDELVMPGVDDLPENGVRLVAANSAFVAAFLAGANHEMQRELIWREYPADLGATVFRRFWDRTDAGTHDIDPIETWPDDGRLSTLGAAGGELTVIVVRADLVRRYPSARILLIDPAGTTHLPAFVAGLGADVRVTGFDVDPDDVVPREAGALEGDGWLVAIEEPQTEPRFGLDRGPGPTTLPSWDDLAWRHLADREAEHLSVGAGLAAGLASPPGARWGANSAHQARATFQRPFRILFRAVNLIGRGG